MTSEPNSPEPLRGENNRLRDPSTTRPSEASAEDVLEALFNEGLRLLRDIKSLLSEQRDDIEQNKQHQERLVCDAAGARQ